MYIYKYGSHAGPPTTSLNSDPCSIRVSSVAQGSLASLLSGTSVRSVAKEQERASVPHFLDKPRVRPLPTELQIGSLLPARSFAGILDPNGQNPKTRRVVVLTPDRELAAGFPIVVAGVTGTLPNPLTADYVKLPYKNPPGRHPKTGLTKEAAVLCTWVVSITPNDIRGHSGF